MVSEMFSERTALAAGALLHDIGKVILRANLEESIQKLAQAEREYHYKEKFKYSHAYLSYLVLKTLFPEEPYIIESSYHHDPQNAENKKIAFIYQLADQFSSKERSERTRELSDPFLRPIFQNIGFEEKFRDEFVYSLAELKLDKEVIFPKRGGIEEKAYPQLWNKFINELRQIKEEVRGNTRTQAFLSRLYYLLYKYFWCVPASTYDRERGEAHYPDISLFDHLRITATLATSLWTDFNQKKLEELLENQNLSTEKAGELVKLVLVRGDVSGIQAFLYDIANLKGVTKRLRGRSAFLALLPELVARKILRELEYPTVNLLFCGGGHFELLIGYEEGIENKLERFEREIERVLVKEFGGKLGLVLSFKVFTLKKLKNYFELIQSLYKEIEKKKKRKFAHLIASGEFEDLINERFEEGANYILCPSCRWEVVREKEVEDEEKVCFWCRRFAEIGGVIPKSVYIVFTEKELPKIKGFYLETLGGVYFLSEEKVKELSPEKFQMEVLKLNDTDFLPCADGFKFLALTVPTKEKEVLTFEELEKFSEGDEKLSFARADVDNLGLIFREGLGKDYSISRVATLSRMLDLFFSGYLKTLFDKEEFKNKVYTVYAGGDDLFIIGPWNVVLNALREIRKDFKDYTCQNQEIDLSCGIFTGRHSYPLRFAGEKAGEAENNAKDKKPAICVFDEVLKWDSFEMALAEAKKFVENFFKKKETVGRSLFYKFYLLLKHYKELEAKDEEARYKFYPMFFYYLLRNVKDKELRNEIVEFFMKVEKDYEIREDALFKAKYVIMATRR
jgi:CRISPR-associated protein Csm1